MKEKTTLLNKFEKIANKVYCGHKNAIYMLINDLENFFEIESNDSVANLTDEQFKNYISEIFE